MPKLPKVGEPIREAEKHSQAFHSAVKHSQPFRTATKQPKLLGNHSGVKKYGDHHSG